MRVALACSLLVLAACGGSQKPAATESADTSSLESPSSGSTGSSDTSSSSSTSSSTSTATATDKPAPAASSAPAAATAAPPASNHPVPGATGAIDGKPFTPKLAQVAGPLQKDGRLLIVLHEGSDCVTSADAKPGTASMMLMVPWKDGYKVDLASLKRAKKNSMGEATFIRVGDDKKNQVATDFKPTGLVTIVSAPMQQDAIGKMKIDLQSGDYMLAGDLDVKVCFPPK